jgi:hypothetical protein
MSPTIETQEEGRPATLLERVNTGIAWVKNIGWALCPVVAMIYFTGVFTTKAEISNAAVDSRLVKLETEERSIKDDMATRGKTRDDQIQKLMEKMLSREVFDAVHNADEQRLDRIENNLQKLLERP